MQARRRASRAFQHEVSSIAMRFETALDRLLSNWMRDTIADKVLPEVAAKMVEQVDEKDVVALVHKKMDRLTTQQWRTLQLAFARELKGSYRQLDLFKSFFSKFALLTSPLEESLEGLREMVEKLVQTFMLEEIIATLASETSEGSSTRSGADVSEEVKEVVKEAVQYCVAVGGPQRTLTLEEALGVLKRGLKGGHSSLKVMLYDSQVDSLQRHLLSQSSSDGTSIKDRRKKDGRCLLGEYKEVVSQKASSVIEGAKQGFCDRVEKSVDDILKQLKSRFIDRRGKSKSLPVLLKIRRECFKYLYDRYGAADAGPERGDRLPPLLEEFASKWSGLMSDDALTDSAEADVHSRLVSSIYLRHLYINLQQRNGVDSRCKATQGKVSRHEAKLVSFSEAKQAIEQMKTGPAGVDLISNYYAFIDKLKAWKLSVGYSSEDSNCLFSTLNQFLLNHKLARPDDDTGGAADAASAMEPDGSTMKLRQAIVDIVLQRHATPEQREQFEKCYGVSVQDWARRMRRIEESGDDICIEYFARHFKLFFRVYSPMLDNPLQFPTYFDMGITKWTDVTSVFRIAHLPCEPESKVVKRHRYVPVWPASVQTTTPAGTPLWEEHEYEPDGELKSSIHDRLSEDRRKICRKQAAGDLMVQKADADMQDASADDGVRQFARDVRERQLATKLPKDENFKKYWTCKTSSRNGMQYCMHLPSGMKCWPGDLEKVRRDRHEKIKLPVGMPR